MATLESHLSSAAAFVEGGVQEACDDSCSICLDLFCDSNPVTVTSCKHGYHLQCILEWAQRSKECPMCWQPLSLKDPSCQELLDAVEQEKSASPSFLQRNPMGGFEFHQVPVFVNDSDFEERIIHHLAVAARAHHFARRESLRNRSVSTQDNPQLVIVPTIHSSTRTPLAAGSCVEVGRNFTSSSTVGPSREQSVSQAAYSFSDPLRVGATNGTGADAGRPDRYITNPECMEENQQRSVFSEILSISESLKSRFAAASSRYKETFTRTTRGFKERLRTQNNGMPDRGAHTRDMSVGVARVLERISPDSNGKKSGDDVLTTSCGTSVLNDKSGCESSSTTEARSGSGGDFTNHSEGQETSRALLQPPTETV